MSRASGCLWLVVGLILALVAGGIAYITLQRATTAPTVARPAETAPVVVAARPIEPGVLLTAADVTIQAFPINILPAGVISNTTDAVGMVTMASLNTGETVLTHHLTKPDITGENLGFTLPTGKVAVALTAEDLLSKGQLIATGQRVDLFYSLMVDQPTSDEASGGKKQFTFGTLQGIIVVSVLRSGGGEQAKSAAPLGAGDGGEKVVALAAPYAYILALDAQDALVLKYLRDAGEILDLAVRSIADDTEHPVQPVDLQYLIDKYQLPAQ